ncbi:MAG: hypothetical protein ACR2I5_08580 [Candidatus Limnocylindria bacterium]
MAFSTCPTCGKPRAGVERFCPSCGLDYWKAASGSGQPVTTPTQAAPPDAGGSSRLPLVLGGLIVLAVLVGGAYIYLNGVTDDINSKVANELGGDDPTPRPTPTPELVGGTGQVTFGIGLDENLHVEAEQRTFAVGELGSFSGSFAEPAGATSLDVIVSSRDAAGAEGVIYTESVSISDPAFDIFGIEEIDLSALVNNAPGAYMLRIYRETTKLAEGEFTVTP